MATPKSISGARIRDARHRAQMTQQALAHAAGVSERNVVRWENDHNTPRADHVAAIARATGQDVDFFYSDGQEDGPMAEPFRRPRRPSTASGRAGRGESAGASVTEDAA